MRFLRQSNLAWLSLLFFALQSVGQNAETAEVLLSLDDGRVPLHAPVKASLIVHNVTGDKTIEVMLGADDKQAFTLEVQQPDGATGIYRIHLESGLHTTGIHSIEPKGTYYQETILNDWYNFGTPGVYKIKLVMQASSEVDVEASHTKEEMPLIAELRQSIEILPANSAYLARECEELLATITTETSYDSILRAADNLSGISDSVAVPYLVQAAEKKPVIASRVISGLERIGNDRAAEGLVKLAGSSNPGTRASAVSALLRLETATTNAALRDQIRQSLPDLPRPNQ